jgi:hypothetical protein
VLIGCPFLPTLARLAEKEETDETKTKVEVERF